MPYREIKQPGLPMRFQENKRRIRCTNCRQPTMQRINPQTQQVEQFCAKCGTSHTSVTLVG